MAVLLAQQRPVRVHFRSRRRRARPEDAFECLMKATASHGEAEKGAERSQRELLDKERAVLFGKQSAVEKADGAKLKTKISLIAARENLLRDRVAVIMRENVSRSSCKSACLAIA